MIKIDIDTTDEFLNDTLELVRSSGLNLVRVVENGPASGQPMVELEGEVGDLFEFLVNFYDYMDSEDAMALIKEQLNLDDETFLNMAANYGFV